MKNTCNFIILRQSVNSNQVEDFLRNKEIDRLNNNIF